MQAAPQIFISHSRRDSTFVEQLERIITTWGMQPWVDRQQLAGGQQWSDELRHAIAASSALVLVLTPPASASLVVRREYLTAIEHHIPVIVVQMKAATTIPTELTNAPTADFAGARWRGEEALFLRLAEKCRYPGESSPPAREMAVVHSGHALIRCANIRESHRGHHGLRSAFSVRATDGNGTTTLHLVKTHFRQYAVLC